MKSFPAAACLIFISYRFILENARECYEFSGYVGSNLKNKLKLKENRKIRFG